MIQNKFEDVCSILRGDSIGCINIGSRKEFTEIASRIIGFGCFRDVVYNALIESIVSSIKNFRESGLLDDSYDAFDVYCEDPDYRLAYQMSVILFPSVLCYCERTRENKIENVESVYAFCKLGHIDIENIADMFKQEVRSNICDHLSRCKTTEDATEIIINGMFILPF